MARFPSAEWVTLYQDAINGNPAYKVGGANWDKGVVALICKAKPDVGLEEYIQQPEIPSTWVEWKAKCEHDRA